MAGRRRWLLLAVLLVAAAPLCSARAALNAGTDSEVELAVPAPRDSYTVAILADRTTGYESGLHVLEQAVRELNLLEPALVLHIGDLVPGYTRDMQKWVRDIRRVKDVLAGLQPPFFPVVGNHDVITGTANPNDRRGEDLYKQHFGPLYYSFDFRDSHFVCLNSEESLQSRPRFSDAQLEWLRDDLEAAGARHVFVFVHKPVWEYEGDEWERIHAVLKQHPVRAVFGGHFHHYYRSDLRDGIQYYVLGVTGGRAFSPRAAGGLEHYCLLRIGADSWKLVLVRPGSLLADDYVVRQDFKNMEKLRFLSRDEAGVAAAVRSPELGEVREQISVHVTNPLDRPLDVTLRGLARGAPWSFRPDSTGLVLDPGERRHVDMTLSSPRVAADRLVVPEVEIQYTYLDSKGRHVPLVLRRRVPLERRAGLEPSTPAIGLDGRADEPEWRGAPLLSTARWRHSPYESEEPGPTFRLLGTPSGLYFFAESPDRHVSSFRGERMLSDAVFLGALASPGGYEAGALERTPVVIIYPFGHAGPEAVRAFWDPRRPMGAEAEGVHVAARRIEGGGWRCEGFVPWDALLPEGGGPPAEVRGTREEVRFNIGAWDNDGELFTELHSWAPTSDARAWGRLILTAPEE